METMPEKISVPSSTPASSGRSALIGPGIRVKGDISGDENLVVEGKVDGKILLENNQVEVGQTGRVNADISAKVIKIAGEVRGDITGTEKVIILRSGNVHGNIVAPRMTLEDGAIFKGSIDMDPNDSSKTKLTNAVKKPADKPAEKVNESPKAVSTGAMNDSKSESKGYTLNGS